MTDSTLQVLHALLADPTRERYGLELRARAPASLTAPCTGSSSGSRTGDGWRTASTTSRTAPLPHAATTG
jgi:hypothetical protein